MGNNKVSIVLGSKKHEISKIKEEKTFETLEDLGSLISTYVWSPFIFQEAHPEDARYKWRKASNMCGASVFALDIDSGLPLSGALERLRTTGLECIVGTSKSHQKDKNGSIQDRYRIVFTLESDLILPSQVRLVFDKLFEMFPEADPACKDAARIYYPCTAVVYVQAGQKLQVPEFKQTQHEQKQIVTQVGSKLPLAKSTYALLVEGAPEGTRNTALTNATHDAIQQQWLEYEFIDLLKTSNVDWINCEEAFTKVTERYKNFIPQHAPRVPAVNNNKPNKVELLPLNQIKPALLKWLEDNDITVSYNRTLYMGTNCLLAADVVRKVVLHLSALNMAVHEKIVEYTLQEWIDEKRLAHLEAVRLDINTVDIEAGTAECRRFLSVLKDAYTDLDIAVLRHMMWQVKRKINGLRTKHEMMLVLTGGQGAGKSTALRDVFFSPLGDLAYSAADFNTLADQREGRLFSDHYIIMFDEMSGAHKSDMERTKQIITSGVIKQRRMGTTSHDSLPMNATFFGSANNPLETLIRDQTGMRRFYEIVVDALVLTRPRWPILKTIDAKLMWASVDHEDENTPIETCMEDLRVKQEEIRDKNIVEYLLTEGIIEKTTAEQEYTSALALSHVVDLTMGQKWSGKALAKEWKRFGIEKHRGANGSRYAVRITDSDIIGALRTKYGMNLKAGEF